MPFCTSPQWRPATAYRLLSFTHQNTAYSFLRRIISADCRVSVVTLAKQ